MNRTPLAHRARQRGSLESTVSFTFLQESTVPDNPLKIRERLLDPQLRCRDASNFEDALQRGCSLENLSEQCSWLEREADSLQKHATEAGESRLAAYAGRLVDTFKALTPVLNEERERRLVECARFENEPVTPHEAVHRSHEPIELVFVSRYGRDE